MRIEIREKIGFEPRTQTPGTVLSVPGDASSTEAEDWLSRGLAKVLDEPLADRLAEATHALREARKGKRT